MKFSEEFPGKYLKAADIKELPLPLTVTITNIEVEEAKSQRGTSTVHVLYTDRFEKGIVFKKTMARVLADRYGDEMEGWQGQPVDLVVREQEYGGDTYEVIRFQIPKAVVKPIAKKAKAGDAS
jgi:hypothetical protein